mmetsp:Transcript_3877/g.8319  ORF Transcript_3877/g.8319 Transcript_3877/m.8319 type:complete len:217 (+) Transcript_3877:667-1317(+)
MTSLLRLSAISTRHSRKVKMTYSCRWKCSTAPSMRTLDFTSHPPLRVPRISRGSTNLHLFNTSWSTQGRSSTAWVKLSLPFLTQTSFFLNLSHRLVSRQTTSLPLVAWIWTQVSSHPLTWSGKVDPWHSATVSKMAGKAQSSISTRSPVTLTPQQSPGLVKWPVNIPVLARRLCFMLTTSLVSVCSGRSTCVQFWIWALTFLPTCGLTQLAQPILA